MTRDWLNAFFAAPAFSLSQQEKDSGLLPLFKDLARHHSQNCPAYAKMMDLAFPNSFDAQSLQDIGYIPVSFFKHRSLRSVPDSDVRQTLRSSGTTGALRSQVALDTTTAQITSKALACTLSTLLGKSRRPMLIIDTPSSLNGAQEVGARAAAILGLMPFGRGHVFALRDDLTLDEQTTETFLLRHKDEPVLIYGFTYLVWQALLPFLEKSRVNLSNATLLHSGGWKHLQGQAVSPSTFAQRLSRPSGLNRIINFYGMAEMPGVIFAENQNGLLYPPSFAEVIIRDPETYAPVPDGKAGLVQVLSLLPTSFPGHSLLTEDLGVIESVDQAGDGWKGKGLRILGRVPKAPLRGCSDVIAASGTGST